MAQLLLLPPLLVQVWLECGVYLPSGCSQAALQCALYVHAAVMQIPFLWEVRVALDWTFTSWTSLSLDKWFVLEDVYSGLCSTRSLMKSRRMYAPWTSTLGLCHPS